MSENATAAVASAPVVPEAVISEEPEVSVTEIQQDEEFEPIVEVTTEVPAEPVQEPVPAQPAQEAAPASSSPSPSPKPRRSQPRTAGPTAAASPAPVSRKKTRKAKPARVSKPATKLSKPAKKVETPRPKPARAASAAPSVKGGSPYQDGSARDIMFRTMAAKFVTKEEVCAAAKKSCLHPEAVFAANFFPNRKTETKKLFDIVQRGDKFKLVIK